MQRQEEMGSGDGRRGMGRDVTPLTSVRMCKGAKVGRFKGEAEGTRGMGTRKVILLFTL